MLSDSLFINDKKWQNYVILNNMSEFHAPDVQNFLKNCNNQLSNMNNEKTFIDKNENKILDFYQVVRCKPKT